MSDIEPAKIADHGVIGDLRTAALVAADATIDWYCPERFDAPSVFAHLLDPERGGAWTMAPACDVSGTHQFYFPDSNVLVTRFLTEDGVVEVQDLLPVGPPGAELPRGLVRRVTAVRGSMTLRTVVAPRPDYGRAPVPRPRAEDDGSVVFVGGDDDDDDAVSYRLRATVELACDAEAGAASADFSLREGQTAAFAFTAGDDGPDPQDAERLFDATNAFWRAWLEQGTYRGRWREMVQRSALTLKLLSHRPTGAIVAAATTSLPEQIGGERNWDYRYVWSRDAAFSVYALLRLGYRDEAQAFVGWLTERLRDADGDGVSGPLAVLYDLDGRRTVAEQELGGLAGHRGSSPVRIGNDASDQRQLDIYGEVLDSVYLYNKHGAPLTSGTWDDVCHIIGWVCDHWDAEDAGIWETRAGTKDHTFSRVMCWVAIERMIRVARQRGLPADLPRWIGARDAIYRQVMERGFDQQRGAFVQHYGSDALDASLLIMPMVKFIAPNDPRFLSTLAAIEDELVADSLVHRYDPDLSPDGLDGGEGTLSICSFWYVEALTRVGRLDDARVALEKMFTYANHLGLYAEQVGRTGDQLGNMPQALTHMALVSAAYNLDRALG